MVSSGGGGLLNCFVFFSVSVQIILKYLNYIFCTLKSSQKIFFSFYNFFLEGGEIFDLLDRETVLKIWGNKNTCEEFFVLRKVIFF